MSSENKATTAAPMMGPKRGPGRMFEPSEKASDVKTTLKRMAGYFFHQKLRISIIMLVVIAGTIAAVTAPNLQSHAIDIIAKNREGVLLNAVLIMLAAYITSCLMQFLQGILSAKLGQRIIFVLRQELFDKYVDMDVGYIDRHPHGDLLSRMANDVENVSSSVSQAIPAIISALLTIIGTAAFMLYLCWQLALLSFVSIYLTVIATRYLADRVRRHSSKRQKYLGDLNSLSDEMITSFKTISMFNLKARADEDFKKTSDAMTREGIKTEIYGGIMGPVMNSIGNIQFVVITVFGGIFALHDMLTIGAISAFIVYAKQFGRPINEISMIYGQIQTAIAGAERVFRVLDNPEEDKKGDELKLGALCDVEFKHVSFSYTEGSPVISDFSLKVKGGSRIAIVGATGSGKSTLTNLLLHFYDIDKGSILVGGRDISTVSRQSLRREIAIVLQETVFFSDTLRNNLLYGKEDATDSELLEALKLCYADKIITHLPDGLGTIMENAGEQISYGQRQLLSIARAFVGDPKILILDEATSNIDTRTELYIEKAVEKLMRNRTCFIIAHRLSTIRTADLIVVMDKGRIVESGKHEELLRAKGAYYELVKIQKAGVSEY